MEGTTDKENAEIQRMAENVTALFTGAVYRSAFVSVRKLSNGFNIDSDGVLVSAYLLHCAS